MLDRRLARSPRAQRALADLAGRPLNFDPAVLESGILESGILRTGGPDTGWPHAGWHVDDYRQPLPPEPPGPPVPGGSFRSPSG